MSDASFLRLRNIVKSYDGRRNVVDGISIDIARGECVTLLGPSGSGKTTALMMIAGFEAPASGTIELKGQDLTRSKPYQRNIGMVFQNYALFPHMTVKGNVAFPLRMRGLPKKAIEGRIGEVLALVGLQQFIDTYPRELSGGQQQRVALARALVFNPDLLLLDEPLGALDRNLRDKMQVEIRRIQREMAITMLYVTHDQAEAMTMADRIAVFRSGRLEQVAPPLEIYNNPRSRFVGEFVGDSNLFEASIDPTRPGWVAIEGLGPVRIANGADGSLPGSGVIDLLIRPERLRLVCDSGPANLNTLDMQVETILNYGDSILVVGRVNGRALRLRITGALPETLHEGAHLRVGWAPEEACALPRS